jgi:alkylation response protein AidB-like acyl-CoA dehydrogenase
MSATETKELVIVEEALERLLRAHDPTSDRTTFWGAQYDAGLAWVQNPEGLGGLGVTPALQSIVEERLRAVGADQSNIVRNQMGYGMAGPTLVAHGTDAHKRQLLRPLFTAEEIWCQLFSEPGAGSDVAALATIARPDGDEWIVNGQKVWTTIAHVARWGLLLARTDPNAPKHKGLTYFIVDMHAPGVDVRPLRQMTGEAEFSEVFFSDVRIPDRDRVGEVGAGWNVAMTTLMNERAHIGQRVTREGSPYDLVAALWGQRSERSAVLRHRVVNAHIDTMLLRWLAARDAEKRDAGVPGPEGSIAKLLLAESNKRITELALDLTGLDGLLYESYAMTRPDEVTMGIDDPGKAFLRARANSIEGGTSEIMRNILGERVLGLPHDVRVDKDRPWSDVPRS